MDDAHLSAVRDGADDAAAVPRPAAPQDLARSVHEAHRSTKHAEDI
jgi:hypothetical protein